MKKEQDGFILMDFGGFIKWLRSQSIRRKVVRLQNHHTWRPDYSSFKNDNHIFLLKNMRFYHTEHNGWSDIAQNITTFPDGTVAVCRSFERKPVGIKGANTGSICIEHVGNFDSGGDEMTEAHKNTIIQLNALLCRAFGLTPNTDSIVYHHWWDLSTGKRTNGEGSTKSCPGTNFFGGNSVGSAETNLIPLVAKAYSTIKIGKGQVIRKKGIVTADVLNIRNTNKTSGDITGKVFKGFEVRILQEKDGWYRINAKEWVCSKYVRKL